MKRKKRIDAPFFYSSATMHCLNKLHSARRGKKSNVQSLESELTILIDMDKQVFLNSIKNFSTNDAFSLLKKLNGNSCLPGKVFYNDLAASNDFDKANLFNRYFSSVFQPKATFSTEDLPFGKLVKLSEVEFSLNDIQILLAKVPDSSIAACDGVPPTILNKAADTLSTLLYLVFSYVVRTQKWPDTWKCAFVTPVFKKGSRANVENYRPISILPRISLIFEKLLFMYIYGKIKDFTFLMQGSMVFVRNILR